MLTRILEPEVMDTAEEAIGYNRMDHSTVNRVFVDDLLAVTGGPGPASVPGQTAAPSRALDVGTGTALIPIELCRRSGRWYVTAVDLAQAMLDVGATNLRSAGLADRITLQRLDAKELPFADGSFDLVMSNSILHHIPKPEECLAEMVRMVSPSGVLFVRDLLRPATTEELEHLVLTYAGNETEQQRGMFRDSLHAALSLEELRGIAAPLGIPANCIRQTTDRHWTLVWSRR